MASGCTESNGVILIGLLTGEQNEPIQIELPDVNRIKIVIVKVNIQHSVLRFAGH